MAIRIVLFRFDKSKDARDRIWPEMTLAIGHWPYLHLDHHHWPEMRSSRRFRMVTNETVAVPPQNVVWIAIWSDMVLGKMTQVSYHWGSGSRNFQVRCKLPKSWTLQISLRPAAFLRELLLKTMVGVHRLPPPPYYKCDGWRVVVSNHPWQWGSGLATRGFYRDAYCVAFECFQRAA